MEGAGLPHVICEVTLTWSHTDVHERTEMSEMCHC